MRSLLPQLTPASLARRTCQNWSTGSHALVDAVWTANESAVLIALDRSGQLGVLHLVGSAPSLLAHLLPIDLPVLSAMPSGAVHISSLAFDIAARKLAVACTAPGEEGDTESKVYLYDLQSSPVYLARLLQTVQSPAAAGLPRKVHVAIRPGVKDEQMRTAMTITWEDCSVASASV